MLSQPESGYEQFAIHVIPGRSVVVGQAHRLPHRETATDAIAPQSCGRDAKLETKARELLRSLGANRIAKEIRIEWNPRLKTAAGRADYRHKLISLNRQLLEHPAEIDPTLTHKLPHVHAQPPTGAP